MQYNPSCATPVCFLTLEDGKEEQRSLADIQQYIESENKRLERDPTRSFDPREINIRMEYRYCRCVNSVLQFVCLSSVIDVLGC
jgi:hypothetical protein